MARALLTFFSILFLIWYAWRWNSSMKVRMEGSIAKGDAKLFSYLVDQLQSHIARTYGECHESPRVILDSLGGEVGESLAIGRLIRAGRLRTEVPDMAKCYSSCVFLLAAGVDRSVKGVVAIHRPYFYDIEKGKSVEEIKIARASQVSRIAAYLESMDVPRSLLDAMISIPPEKMRQLTESDLETYRLTGETSYEEYRTNRKAKLHDMRTSEYRQRLAAVAQKCGDEFVTRATRGPVLSPMKLLGQMIDCNDTELLGIGLDELRARRGRFENCRKKTTNETTQDGCYVKYMTRGEE